MVNHDCSLGRTMTPRDIRRLFGSYGGSAALFICRHCAESWARLMHHLVIDWPVSVMLSLSAIFLTKYPMFK